MRRRRERRRGNGGRRVGGVLFQNGKKLGRFENLCSCNRVSAAGQVTAEMLMLISNLWRGALMCSGQLFAVGYKKLHLLQHHSNTSF